MTIRVYPWKFLGSFTPKHHLLWCGKAISFSLGLSSYGKGYEVWWKSILACGPRLAGSPRPQTEGVVVLDAFTTLL